MPAVLMILQAATVAVPTVYARDCTSTGDEIVVCHRAVDPDHYRLPMRGDQPDTKGPPRAEWGLGGGARMGVAMQSQAMPQGAVSDRVMVTVKIPF